MGELDTKVKDIILIVGCCCIIGSLALSIITFYYIVFVGNITFYEPNLIISSMELFAMILGIPTILYFLKKVIYDQVS